jgi:hypothetical protein
MAPKADEEPAAPKRRSALRGGRAGRVVASAPSVVQTAGLMESAGTAWHAVKYGNLEVGVCSLMGGV